MEEQHQRPRRGSGSFFSHLTTSVGNLAPGRRSSSSSAERDSHPPTLTRAKSLSNIHRPKVCENSCFMASPFPLCFDLVLTNMQVPSGPTDSTSNAPTESPTKKEKRMSSITRKRRGRAHSTLTASDSTTSKAKWKSSSKSCDHDLKPTTSMCFQ